MHEYAITENIVSLVIEESKNVNDGKVKVINITIGELSSVIPECIEMYFEILAKGTPIEAAKLNFNMISAEMECKKCGERFFKDKSKIECPVCGELGRFTDKGREFFIESIIID